MKPKMTIEESILDSLADGCESIKQIEEYLSYLTVKFDRKLLRQVVLELMENKLIRISEPPNQGKIEFENLNDDQIFDFWFELTTKGYSVWEKIET